MLLVHSILLLDPPLIIKLIIIIYSKAWNLSFDIQAVLQHIINTMSVIQQQQHRY